MKTLVISHLQASKITNTSTNEEPVFLSVKIVSTLSKVIVSVHASLTDSLRGWVMVRAAGGCQQCSSYVKWLAGLPLIYPSGGCDIWCICLLVFSAASLKLCRSVCSVHYRLQQEGLWTVDLDCAWSPGLWSHSHDGRPSTWAKHLTFHSSLNQADDQEQVQTAHIMQTFYKVVFHSSLTLCMFVYLQSFFMWYGWAENHSVDKTIS